MITDRQKMQLRRAFAYKHGFDRDSVVIELIAPVKGSVAIQGAKILIEVDFRHEPTRFRGTERFVWDPSDLRKMPYLEPKKVTYPDIAHRIKK
jgi:hypothetical protein